MSEPASTPPDELTMGAGIDFTDPNAPLAPCYLRASHVAAVVLLAAVFLFFSLLPPLWHSDFWGHLKHGEWIVDHQALPEQEPFSPYAEKDSPLLHFMWLSQASYCVVFRAGEWLAGGDARQQLAGGVEMIRAWHGLLVMLKCAFLLAAYRRISGSLPLALLGVGTVLFFSLAPTAVQRPQALGELCFAVLLWALSGKELSRAAVLGIPLLVALWANLHGSFLMGLGLLGAFVAGRGVETIVAGRRPWRDVVLRRQIAAAGLAFLAVGLLNPHGFGIFERVMAMSRHPNIATMDEWQPLDFTQAEGGHWGFLMMLLLLIASQAVSRVSLAASQIFVVLVFGMSPLFQQRLMTWWFMLLPWLVMPLWKDVLDRLAERRGRFESVLSLRKTLAAAAVVVIAVVWSGPFQMVLGKQPVPAEKALSKATLLEIAQALNPRLKGDSAANAPAFQGKIYAPEILGDFLLWAVPDAPVLVYAHVQLFPKRHWDEYMIVLFGKAGWWEVLDRHRVNLVVIEAELHKELAELLRKDASWRIVVDEADAPDKEDRRTRLLIARRKQLL